MSIDQRELELALKASSISITGVVSNPESLPVADVTISNRSTTVYDPNASIIIAMSAPAVTAAVARPPKNALALLRSPSGASQ